MGTAEHRPIHRTIAGRALPPYAGRVGLDLAITTVRGVVTGASAAAGAVSGAVAGAAGGAFLGALSGAVRGTLTGARPALRRFPGEQNTPPD